MATPGPDFRDTSPGRTAARRPGRRSSSGWSLALCAGFAGLLAPDAVGAQVAGATEPDTTQVATDSTRIRQLRLLEDLSRGPGVDSARLAADSARIAESGPSGRRRGGGRGAGAARPAPSSGDTLLSALLSLDGYSSARYEGSDAEYDAATGILYLHGDSLTRAVFTRDGNQLSTDSLILFTEETGRMEAWAGTGQVNLVPSEGNELESAYLSFDVEDEQGLARSARTQFNEGAEWIVTGDLPVIRSDLTYGHGTRFTSCDLDEPHYHFKTDEIKIVRGSILVAKPVRLYFGEVPVAWLPFIAQSLSQGRASGILTPLFSVNDIVRSSDGYRRRVSNVGFYWAMNDYMDSQIALDWFDDNFTAITGSYRYRWLRQFLDGSLDFRQFWRAEGGTELTLNTRHNWQISERSSLNVSAAYASSSSFITQNSFNPNEVTQSIDSQGGLSRRFDWGNLTVNGNRRQFLSDDRVETTFPSVNLSLKTITLFQAPANRSRFWNNLTWSGSASFSRSTRQLAESPVYIPNQRDQGTTTARLNSSLNLGSLSVSGSGSYQAGTTFDLRRPLEGGLLDLAVAEQGLSALTTAEGRDELARQIAGQDGTLYGDPFDATRTSLTWNASVNYQQNLVGSVTFTPQVSFSSELLRIDTLEVARDFVAGPTRTTFGATLRGDIFGFFPGFGGFERIRHKVSPSFTYDWSPEVTPTALQQTVFGSRALQPRNVIAVGVNQTFEAKRPAPGAGGGGEVTGGAGTVDSLAPPPGPTPADGEPRRLQQGEVVNLLSLRTSALRYDFVQADSTNDFLQGFETIRVTNQISSDFLRGLTVNTTHELFEDEAVEGGAGPGAVERRFSPRLTQMNLGFSLSGRSAIFRWLGFGGGGDDDEPEPEAAGEEDEPGLDGGDPLMPGRNDVQSILPGSQQRDPMATRRSGGVGDWSANISYSLQRPRAESALRNQMVRLNVRLQPTEMWEMSWNTSYDVEERRFNDHSIRLSRDLHRWRANFDFLQTATGNWSFRFEVNLLDNQDLKFDYQQRSNQTLRRRR